MMRHEEKEIWRQFRKRPLGLIGGAAFILFVLVGVYAPLLASSKPLFVVYDGQWYFPLFRYLFFRGFYTKRLDLFFNLLMFTLPLFILTWKRRRFAWPFLALVQLALFGYFSFGPTDDPASDPELNRERQKFLHRSPSPKTWAFELKYMNDYDKLNALVNYRVLKEQNLQLIEETGQKNLPTLFQADQRLALTDPAYYLEKHKWLKAESEKLRMMAMPLIRPFHWEEDAGGSQSLNRELNFWQLTRTNRKDLTAALIFGVRISLVVGVISVSIALIIGIPLGSVAGYYGGMCDIVLCRLLEVWESMPVLFVLLFVVAILQTKSIFLVMAVIGIFGWTGFSRYMRGEFFKQRFLPYVEACHAQGFPDSYIMLRHILPNAIPPLITLLPFAVMGAITSEAALSFLGLGEEGSCSWGVLMDEGRKAFPGESYLLWPPAILLTTLLISIALMGDALRDALDPKLRVE